MRQWMVCPWRWVLVSLQSFHHLASDLLDLGHALPRNLAPIPDVLLKAEEDLQQLHCILALLDDHLLAGVFLDLVFARPDQASVCFEVLRDNLLPPCELLALSLNLKVRRLGKVISIAIISNTHVIRHLDTGHIDLEQEAEPLALLQSPANVHIFTPNIDYDDRLTQKFSCTNNCLNS